MSDAKAEAESRYPIADAYTPEGASRVYAKQGAFVAGAEWARAEQAKTSEQEPRTYEWAHRVFGELHVNSESYVRAMHDRHGDAIMRRSVGEWEEVDE